MKKKTKNSVKKSGNKSGDVYHILMYVENCTPKIKKFKTTDELGKFVDAFNKQYPDYASVDSGYWVDFCVTGIAGDIHFFTDGIEVV